MNRNCLGTLVPDQTVASTSETRRAARGLISFADGGRSPMPGPQIEPILWSILTPAGWLHVADVLEAETAALETSDPEIARIYRRDVTRIRAQWRRN